MDTAKGMATLALALGVAPESAFATSVRPWSAPITCLNALNAVNATIFNRYLHLIIFQRPRDSSVGLCPRKTERRTRKHWGCLAQFKYSRLALPVLHMVPTMSGNRIPLVFNVKNNSATPLPRWQQSWPSTVPWALTRRHQRPSMCYSLGCLPWSLGCVCLAIKLLKRLANGCRTFTQPGKGITAQLEFGKFQWLYNWVWCCRDRPTCQQIRTTHFHHPLFG